MKKIVWFGFVLTALSAAGKVILIKPGQSVTLECEVTDHKSNLEWCHGNDRIYYVYAKSGISSRGKGEIMTRAKMNNFNLEIRGVKDSDAGKFTCKTNGKPQEHTLLVVSISASPSGDLQLGGKAVLQCQVKGLIPESTVVWSRPGGSPHTGSKVVLKPVAHSDAGTWKCTFSHDEVTYTESLDIKVTEPSTTTPAPVPPQSSMGIPKPPCNNCVTNAPSLHLGLSWWMWVEIGVGCLLLVLLMVFIICLCKRIKRKKRKLHKMKNGHQLLSPKQYCQCNCPTAVAKPQQRRRKEKPSAPPPNGMI